MSEAAIFLKVGLETQAAAYCNRGHHCTMLRLGVVNSVGRDGRPPTHSTMGWSENREREKEGGRERETVVLRGEEKKYHLSTYDCRHDVCTCECI